MKLRHLLPIAMLGMPFLSQAVPAYPGLLSMTNPDGSHVQLQLVGDESFSYMTDAEGVYIYEKNSNGYWDKAMRNGAQLLNVAADIEKLRAEQDAIAGAEEIRANFASRYARVGADGRSMFPTTGDNLKFCVVLFQYSDTKFSMSDPQAFYTRWFNEKNYNYQDLKHSAFDYYSDASKGKFEPTFVVSPVVTLPKTSKFYVGNNKYTNFIQAIIYSMSELENKGFDFSQFDLDKDGKIDNVYFVYAGYGQADTGDTNCIWPHKSDVSSYRLTYNGKTMGAYATSNELRGSAHYTTKDGAIEGIGTFCHEFGHVLGLPDLYDPEYASNTNSQLPGNWTIMCNGPYVDDSRTPPTYTAYEKWVCRWMEYTEAEFGKEYTLKPLADEVGGVRIKVPITDMSQASEEYYIIENRTRKGFDAYIPGDGMLVWHVDFNSGVWDTNKVNSTAGRPRCSVMIPQGQSVGSATWPQKGIWGGLIGSGFANSFKPFNQYDSSFNPYIVNMKYDATTGVGSFKYTNAKPAFDGKVTGLRGLRMENQNRGFYVYWDPVEGAVDYSVTITYNTELNGQMRTIVLGQYDNLLVGNVTSLEGVEKSQFQGCEHTMTIRAIGPECPSSEETEFTFIPNEFTGVGEIEADGEVDIYGGIGRIEAPAGARAFTLSGAESRMENIPAGIYLVRYGKMVRKVVVK